MDESQLRYVMPLHWHTNFEIVRILEGSSKFFINAKEFYLKSGEILLIECGSLHRCEPYDCVYECVVFNLDMLLRHQIDALQKYIYPLITASAKLSNTIIGKNDVLAPLINDFFEAVKNKPPYYELKAYNLLFNIFHSLYANGNIVSVKKDASNHQIEAIVKLISYIEKNFMEKITLSALSEISGYDKKYICRFFKEYTAKTPINYLNEFRIKNACFEISSGQKSITEAAFSNGFNNLSYFCETFKKYMGVSPRQYVKVSGVQKLNKATLESEMSSNLYR